MMPMTTEKPQVMRTCMTADGSGPNNVWHSSGHIASSDQKFAPDSAVMNKTTTETLYNVRLFSSWLVPYFRRGHADTWDTLRSSPIHRMR
jgi:hypothetical protein